MPSWSSSSSALTAPNLRLRTLRIWSSKDYAIAAFIFLILFSLLLFSHLDSRSHSRYDSQPHHSKLVPLTLLRNANQTRALCLDGSAPGYHFQSGFGSGSRNWLIHIEGGGWCNSIPSCYQRKFTHLGSSDHMEKLIPFSGILSSDPAQNPDFFNWNKVKIRYCDGASFAGHPESERGSGLFFRGQVIWEAIMDELLSTGLSNAKQALLSGCSAGGLATLIHCDSFRQVLPKEATVKCLADAGFFLDEKDISGNSTMRSFYHDVAQLQGLAKSLHKDCIAKMEPSKCLFPSEIAKNIKTPLFLVHPAYDFWQIRNILVPQGSDPDGHWQRCRLDIRSCNANMIDKLDSYRGSLLKAVNEFQQRKEIGMFIDSCFVHCQTEMEVTWHSPNSPKINDKVTIVLALHICCVYNISTQDMAFTQFLLSDCFMAVIPNMNFISDFNNAILFP
ncbi:Pectin acetylesterase 5 isoform B [Glycine soja]|uniref:Pectin acetylesterase n=1 Tax=Glycine soja TaxID=3848 RepID=A0A445FUF1_GLYSO|nr:Pectin acetylesterase 5 isoform B [Glycine soja]